MAADAEPATESPTYGDPPKIVVLPGYDVHIYLDTNVLLGLFVDVKRNLREAVTYLASSPFVKLVTSSYALVEFMNKSKYNEYVKRVHALGYSLEDSFKHGRKLDCVELKYGAVASEIEATVMAKMGTLLNDFGIAREDVTPTGNFIDWQRLFLGTRIAHQDCMIIVSAMQIALGDDKDIDLIWSSDGDLCLLACETEFAAAVNHVFHRPLMPVINIKKLGDRSGRILNLYEGQERDGVVEGVLPSIIAEYVRTRNESNYLGRLFVQDCAAANDIFCFTLVAGAQLQASEYFVLIGSDLDGFAASPRIDEFRLEDKSSIAEFPYTASIDTKISFMWPADDELRGVLLNLRRKNTMVFRSIDAPIEASRGSDPRVT